MPKNILTFSLNGQQVTVKVAANRRLVDLLREDFHLTGTKEGCGIGECGACTVLLNGRAVNSCLLLAAQVEGAAIITVEHLAIQGKMNRLQQNFVETGAVQCGFCIPGMLLSAAALLQEKHHPTDDEIKEAIAGNLCRCTGYKQIIQAIRQTAETSQEKPGSAQKLKTTGKRN